MKKLLVTTICAGSMAFSANAYAEAFSGPFVGVEVANDSTKIKDSYTWHEANGDFYEESESGKSISGVSGGVFAGYDARISEKLFAGVEFRANISSAKYKFHSHLVIDETDTDTHSDVTLRARESFSATARLGYMINDNTGLYVRGGLAQTHFKARSTQGFPVAFDPVADEYSFDSTARDKNIGAVFGAGLETKLSDALNVRVEYNVTAYGNAFVKLNQKLASAEALDYDDETFFGSKLKTQQVRLGISHSF